MHYRISCCFVLPDIHEVYNTYMDKTGPKKVTISWFHLFKAVHKVYFRFRISPTWEHCINFIINQKAAQHVVHNEKVVNNDIENLLHYSKMHTTANQICLALVNCRHKNWKLLRYWQSTRNLCLQHNCEQVVGRSSVLQKPLCIAMCLCCSLYVNLYSYVYI